MSGIQHVSQRLFSRAACIVTASLLLGFVLAACGSNTTTGGQPTSTPPPQTVNCGFVTSSYAGVAPTDKPAAKKAANCFYQAYQQCRPATLTFRTFGVDAGDIHHFATKSANGACSISDGVQHYVAPKPPGPTSAYTCATLAMQSDGLHVQSCGTLGTIVIPAV